jgi:NAD-dependent SIR2 family protein deacetylase
MTPGFSNKNVFILGAGFSASAGAPTVSEFFDRSREFFDNPTKRLEEAEYLQFKRVFEFRREMAVAREKITIDLDNIEDLFGLVEMSQRLGGASKETRDNTVYLIAKTLELTTRGAKRSVVSWESPKGHEQLLKQFEYREGACSADVYHLFAGMLGGLLDEPSERMNRTNTVITFNYDLVVDDALHWAGFAPDYALDPDIVQFPAEWKFDRTIPVLKLHGSTNWGVCSSCSAVVVLPPLLATSPAQFLKDKCKGCGTEGGFRPLLVPPSWDKTDYKEFMGPVWKRAVDEIASATRICIIGYSMPTTDAFFKYLITLALARNPGLYSLTVVDLSHEPECALLKRYGEMLVPIFKQRRFHFFSGGTEMFLANEGTYRQLGRGELLHNMRLY